MVYNAHPWQERRESVVVSMGGRRKLFEDERKMRRGRKEKWFNRTVGSNEDVKAGSKRPVTM